jgi:hypothetical protein
MGRMRVAGESVRVVDFARSGENFVVGLILELMCTCSRWGS